MNIRTLYSPAKINLALNVVGKKRSLHKIESIVSFINLYDLIKFKEIRHKKHQVAFNGKFSKNIKKNNTITKLLRILDDKNLLRKKKFQIKITKNIPQKAGLGGGSMNAASLLSFFIKKNFLKISSKQIREICDLIGSDVVLGIYKSNLILNSKGKISAFKTKKNFNIVLVKPKFGCSTKAIYSNVKKYSKAIFNKSKAGVFNLDKLSNLKNDLEPIALRKYSKLKQIKSHLENYTKSKFVRMTGSGSVIVGYYLTKKDSELAKKYINKKFRNYWCIVAKTI